MMTQTPAPVNPGYQQVAAAVNILRPVTNTAPQQQYQQAQAAPPVQVVQPAQQYQQPQGYAAPQQFPQAQAAPPAQNFQPVQQPQGYAVQQQYQQPQTAEQPDYEEGKLGAVFGKDVVLDIKAKLKAPEGDANSAEMMGKYSVYGLTLTKNLPNKQSVTVRANLEWIDILGMAVTALKFAFRPNSGKRTVALSSDSMAQLMTAQQAAMYALGAVQQGQTAQQPIMDCAGFLANAMNGLNGPVEPDYEIDQVKVLPAKTNDGYSPVTSCKITRSGFRKDNAGNVAPARYPWVFTVENFEAMKVVKQNGTTTYNSQTKRPGKWGGHPITVFASDRDVLKLTGKAIRHMLVWDTAANLTRVKNGIQKQLAARFGRRVG